MEIRGRRRCKSCGTRWSYYETGSVSCPDCGSRHSVGIDEERVVHTATAATLDLAPIRADVDAEPLRRLAERGNERGREFTRGYGFIDAGELVGLDETYLAAMELRYASAELSRRMDVGDRAEQYFLSLLRADEGKRPDPDAVPRSMWSTRGMAYADAVEEYRSDLRTYAAEGERPDAAIDGVIERMSTHVRRIRALDGDVEPAVSGRLVAVARDIGRYLSEGDEEALAAAEAGLDALA
ncbi:DUF7117 family protein [Natronomonas sp.]|uniref:DUF7117 family protein n=1 Tax=Natronomonas sp. TaxID=2184060 RepID=UPI002620CBA6|nr:TFIIB-type zinc ribbon-containing protein [Natronomonas sp.]